MFNVADQINAFQRAQMDASNRFAQIASETAQKLTQLTVDYSRASLDDTTKEFQSMFAVKSPNELFAARPQAAEKYTTRAQEFARETYGVTSEAGQKVSAIVESRFAAAHKDLVNFVEESAKYAPFGNEFAVAAAKSFAAASGVAYDTVMKGSKQFTSYAEAAVKAGENAQENVKAFTAKAGKRK